MHKRQYPQEYFRATERRGPASFVLANFTFIDRDFEIKNLRHADTLANVYIFRGGRAHDDHHKAYTHPRSNKSYTESCIRTRARVTQDHRASTLLLRIHSDSIFITH